MALNDYTKTLLASLEEASLVPGPASALIPSSFSAGTVLDVAFSTRNIELGTFIRAGECKQAPRVSFAPEAGTDLASPESSYTLILTDPDAPTPDDPRFAFWRHWVLTGLRPSGDSGGESTSAVTEYLGPGPKDDSKPHRYLFLLYREPEGSVITKEDVGGEEFVQRRSFRPVEFAEKHGLKLVAVNWMTCAGDGWIEGPSSQ